ncbi:DUF6506 family protein [Amycolatopsis sp. WAC 04182]|uniref:DUF6506 family protein n=1 Tax=Amycolatopsis sp. WAC 04182 TaxID=2203198 RepID=UPI00351596A2
MVLRHSLTPSILPGPGLLCGGGVTTSSISVRRGGGRAQLIELCGAFGPVWTARVIDAVGSEVPVGSVMYGAEATKQLHDLFDPGA